MREVDDALSRISYMTLASGSSDKRSSGNNPRTLSCNVFSGGGGASYGGVPSRSLPKIPPFANVHLAEGASPVVELRFSAEGLADCDLVSLSDPFAVVNAEHFGIGVEELGRTETVLDDLNPKWTSTIVFRHVRKATPTTLIVDVFDRDAPCEALEKHDFLGRATFSVDDVMKSDDMRIVVPLRPCSDYRKKAFGPTPKGTLTVIGEYVRPAQLPERKVEFRVSAVSLKGKGFFKRDVLQFYEVQRLRSEPDGSDGWTPVYRSEDGKRVDAEGYVVFSPRKISEQLLSNMQRDRRLRLAFFKRNRNKPHQLISYAEITMESFENMGPPIPLEGCYGDDNGLGSLLISDVWHHGNINTTVVELAVDHFLHNDFVSALNDKPGRRRILRTAPSFVSLH